MKKKLLIVGGISVSALILFVIIYFLPNQTDSGKSTQYPSIPDGYKTKISEFNGLKYETYYDILNQDTSEIVLNWLKSENEFTHSYLQSLPNYDNVNQTILRYSNFRRFEYAKRDGGLYIFSEIDPRNNQYKVFYSNMDKYEPVEIFKTSNFYPQGNYYFKRATPSLDGKYLAILNQNEEQYKAEIIILNIDSSKNPAAKPIKLKASVNSGLCWSEKGLFYNSPDALDLDKNAVWFYNLSEGKGESELIYSNPKLPQHHKYPYFSYDRKHFIINSYLESEGSEVCYSEYSATGVFKFKILIPQTKFYFKFVEKVGNSLIFLTNENAPNKKLVKIDITQSPYTPIELIAEDSMTLQRVTFNQGRFVALYFDDLFGRVKLYDSTGAFIEKGELPEQSFITGFRGKAKDSDLLFISSTLNKPNEIMKFDALRNRFSSLEKPRTNFNPNNYVINNIYHKTPDNHTLNIVITHQRDINMDGTNPLFLWVNSIENLNSIPGFGYGKIDFMERGGVFVVVNLFRNVEPGKMDFKEIMRLIENSSSNLNSVFKYLIDNKITNNEKIAAGSSGLGALVLANLVIKQPELLRCLFLIDGLFDLTSLINKTENTQNIRNLFGEPADTSEFRMCLNNSPIYKLSGLNSFPATYIEHRFYNNLIPAANSCKMAILLQKNKEIKEPVLLSVNNLNSNLTLDQDVTLRARRWSFVEHHLKMQ
jgi:prolyl oligopeptidase